MRKGTETVYQSSSSANPRHRRSPEQPRDDSRRRHVDFLCGNRNQGYWQRVLCFDVGEVGNLRFQQRAMLWRSRRRTSPPFVFSRSRRRSHSRSAVFRARLRKKLGLRYFAMERPTMKAAFLPPTRPQKSPDDSKPLPAAQTHRSQYARAHAPVSSVNLRRAAGAGGLGFRPRMGPGGEGWKAPCEADPVHALLPA